MIELRGTEVVLRPLVQGDAPLLAAASAESRKAYQFSSVPEGVGGAEAYIARALEQQARNERMPFAILYRDRVVGSTSYADLQYWQWPEPGIRERSENPDVLEIGYTWLADSVQRTGCNTEAKLLLLSNAFDSWQVHRVSFRTDERNQRSRDAIARLGASFEGIRRADMPAIDGGVRDSAYYSIVAAEWPGVRKRLSERLGR